MTMYKAFVRPQLGYGDIIYDEVYNEKFHQKLEYSIQCLSSPIGSYYRIAKKKTLPSFMF